jgi:hypothetical protein
MRCIARLRKASCLPRILRQMVSLDSRCHSSLRWQADFPLPTRTEPRNIYHRILPFRGHQRQYKTSTSDKFAGMSKRCPNFTVPRVMLRFQFCLQ